jgi:hypothetical protein
MQRVEMQLKALGEVIGMASASGNLLSTGQTTAQQRSALLDLFRGFSDYAMVGALASRSNVNLRLYGANRVVLRDSSGKEVTIDLRDRGEPQDGPDFYQIAPSPQEMERFLAQPGRKDGLETMKSEVCFYFSDPFTPAKKRAACIKAVMDLLETKLREQELAHEALQKQLANLVKVPGKTLAVGESVALLGAADGALLMSALRLDGSFKSDAERQKFMDDAKVVGSSARVMLAFGVIVDGQKMIRGIDVGASRY